LVSIFLSLSLSLLTCPLTLSLRLVCFSSFTLDSLVMLVQGAVRTETLDTCLLGHVGLSDTLSHPKAHTHTHTRTHTHTHTHRQSTYSLTLSPLSGFPRYQFPSWRRRGMRRWASRALLVRPVGLFHYANEVTAKVIIPHCRLQSLPSQTLLRQLAHSQSWVSRPPSGEGVKDRPECSGEEKKYLCEGVEA